MRPSTLLSVVFSAVALPYIAIAGSHSSNARRHGELAARMPGDVNLHKRFSNTRFTFYKTGLGACGKVNNDGDFIVALNDKQFGGGYPGPHCFQRITICYNGKCTGAQITDMCPGCPFGGLDLSPGLFSFFASRDKGVIYGSWTFGGDGGGGGGGDDDDDDHHDKPTPKPKPKPKPKPEPKPEPKPDPKPAPKDNDDDDDHDDHDDKDDKKDDKKDDNKDGNDDHKDGDDEGDKDDNKDGDKDPKSTSESGQRSKAPSPTSTTAEVKVTPAAATPAPTPAAAAENLVNLQDAYLAFGKMIVAGKSQ